MVHHVAFPFSIPGDLCTSTKRRPDLETNAIECLAFELLHDPRHILLFAYRPPDQSPTHFFESLHTLLATASSESTTLSVFGDLNAKHSSWQSDGSCNTAGNKFFELLLDFGLTQCVHSPTRFSSDGHSCSVIDIYATNRPELITDIEISDPVSDHCMVTASIKMHRAPPKSTKKLTKLFMTSGMLIGTKFVLTSWKFQFFKQSKGLRILTAPWQCGRTWSWLFCSIVSQHAKFE